MKRSLRRVVHCVRPGALAAVLLLAVGCDGFFVKEGTGGTVPGNTGSYAYVSNPAGSSTSLAAYSLTTGTLAPVTGSPFPLGFVPAALSVTPANTFLYAATNSVGFTGIYAYTIAPSTGALTLANGGKLVAALTVAAMDISPDGKYLVVLNLDGSSLNEYSIDPLTGMLTFAATVTYATPTGTVVTPSAVKIAPSGAVVVCALGTAGDLIFPYNAGTINPAFVSLATGSNSSGDYSLALDNSNFLYVARTTGLAVYSLSTAGVPTAVVGSPFSTGTTPRSVVINKSSVYVANQGSGTISAFSIASTGALTNLAGSPYDSVTSASVLGVDNSGKYLLALGYDKNIGLQMYAIGAGGGLTPVLSNVATGTVATVPAVMALTH